jgi:single-strand DNA-binding protein
MGRVVADPELKQTATGISVTSFTLAVDRPGKDSGTDFLDCVAWRNTAEFFCKWFSKGSPVVVEGSLQTRMYEDKNGQKRKAVEVVASNIFFVPKAKGATVEHAEHEENTFEHGSFSAGSNSDFEEVEDDFPW